MKAEGLFNHYSFYLVKSFNSILNENQNKIYSYCNSINCMQQKLLSLKKVHFCFNILPNEGKEKPFNGLTITQLKLQKILT